MKNWRDLCDEPDLTDTEYQVWLAAAERVRNDPVFANAAYAATAEEWDAYVGATSPELRGAAAFAAEQNASRRYKRSVIAFYEEAG